MLQRRRDIHTPHTSRPALVETKSADKIRSEYPRRPVPLVCWQWDAVSRRRCTVASQATWHQTSAPPSGARLFFGTWAIYPIVTQRNWISPVCDRSRFRRFRSKWPHARGNSGLMALYLPRNHCSISAHLHTHKPRCSLVFFLFLSLSLSVFTPSVLGPCSTPGSCIRWSHSEHPWMHLSSGQAKVTYRACASIAGARNTS